MWKASHCPNVDLLILETARKGIIDYGIGFRKCNVGIVTNIYEDHLGYNGINSLEEMAELKSIVIKHTKSDGVIVLNGDDPLVRDMAKISSANKIYFMLNNDYCNFDNVFYLKNGYVRKKIGAENKKIVHVRNIPLTIQGKLTYNILNVLAVLAVIEGMKKSIPIKDHTVKKALIGYGSRLTDNIERFVIGNLYREKFIFCNSKNPEGYRNDINFIVNVKEEGFDHVIGILSSSGNRNEKHYMKISEQVAPVCDLFFIYPPNEEYLRGRSGEEIVRLLSTNISKSKIRTYDNFSLPEIISSSSNLLTGKKLFVLFSSRLLMNINLDQLASEGEFVDCFCCDEAEPSVGTQ